MPISSLGNEYFRHDPDSQTLTGEAVHPGDRLGQRVTVRLVEAAPITGGLLFELLEIDGRRMPTPPRRGTKGGPRRAQDQSRIPPAEDRPQGLTGWHTGCRWWCTGRAPNDMAPEAAPGRGLTAS